MGTSDQTHRELLSSEKEISHAIDWNPLEGQTSADAEDKYYAQGIGLIVDDVVELISCTE